MSGGGFYVVGMYDGGPSLLTPTGAEAGDGLTWRDAMRAVWWQYQPRGESPTPWYICQPDPDAPGVMIGRRATLPNANGGPGSVHVAPGETAERLDIGARAFPLTPEAHESTLAAIWPAPKSL